MIKIGQFNFLKISQKTARGTFLHAGEFGMVFLPVKQTPAYCEVGDKIQVFLYRDSRNEVIATTKKPKVEMDGVACLKVVSVSTVGAFMDWGLPKDLFVPFGEQSKRMQVDEFHIVRVYQDNTGRVCASSKLNKFIKAETNGINTGDQLNLIVGDKSDLGYKMIVNQCFWGMLHNSDVFRELTYGQRLKGFVKNLRTDKRIDISLKEPGFRENESLGSRILKRIEADKGFTPINDKTAPEIIYKEFGVSKKVFKAEIGVLYKKRKILIDKEGIRIPDNSTE